MSAFFKTFPIVTLVPIKIGVDEVSIDDAHVEYDEGSNDPADPDKYRLCEIRAGSLLWAFVYPNYSVAIQQHKNDRLVILSDARPGRDFAWADTNNNPQAFIDAGRAYTPRPPQLH